MSDTYIQLFFIISSVGFVLLWVLVGIFLFYLIKTMQIFHRMSEKLEKSINEMSDSVEDMVEDIRNHSIYRLIFGSKNKSRKTKSK